MAEDKSDPKLARIEAKAAKAKANALRPWYQKKRVILPVALAAIIGIATSMNNNADSTGTSSTSTSADSGDTTTDSSAAEGEAPAEEYSNETPGQQNARESAESYLSFSAFSRKGLIDQLEFEQYSTEDAEYAVDILNVDWDGQAVLSAESYLDNSAFSRSGLIDQLKYEGFTKNQATYGVDAQNADWNEQAALSAESYLQSSSFSRDGLIDQLVFEGFTKKQAEYGVTQAGL